MKQIVFFGDSLTAGYALQSPSTASFPALLQKKIDALGFQYKVYNAGLSGDTTTSALDRLEQVSNIPAEIFVIALGANDMLRNHNPLSTAANLQKIIAMVKSKHPEVQLILLGMELPAWISAAGASQYRNLFRQIAEEHGMPFLPFLLDGVAGKQEFNIADGLHPNAAGYQIIADRVWPILHSLLQSKEN